MRASAPAAWVSPQRIMGIFMFTALRLTVHYCIECKIKITIFMLSMVNSTLNNQALLIEISLQTSGEWINIPCHEAG
jgi:hypothetical protein